MTSAFQSLGARSEGGATLAIPLRTESAEAYWRSRIQLMDSIPGARERLPQVFIAAQIGIGNIDGALDLMERLVEMHSGHCVFLKSDPAWNALRGRPRYGRSSRGCSLRIRLQHRIKRRHDWRGDTRARSAADDRALQGLDFDPLALRRSIRSDERVEGGSAFV